MSHDDRDTSPGWRRCNAKLTQFPRQNPERQKSTLGQERRTKETVRLRVISLCSLCGRASCSPPSHNSFLTRPSPRTATWNEVVRVWLVWLGGRGRGRECMLLRVYWWLRYRISASPIPDLPYLDLLF